MSAAATTTTPETKAQKRPISRPRAWAGRSKTSPAGSGPPSTASAAGGAGCRSGDVDHRAPLGVGLGLSQDLVRDGRDVALAEEDETGEVLQRIPLGPTEVDVRALAGLIADREEHGGDLWAESSIGNGSRFFIELPLQPPSSRPRVLLVSDDAKWLREISRTLKSACDVRSTTLAAAKLGNKRTDLVLVDPSKKPGKKLEALRSEAKGAQVPVIELPSQMAASRLARTLAHLAV